MFSANIMSSYCNIVIQENPCVNKPITIKVSAIPKAYDINSDKPANLEVYMDDKKHAVE